MSSSKLERETGGREFRKEKREGGGFVLGMGGGGFAENPDSTDGTICPYDDIFFFFFFAESQLGAFISRGGRGAVLGPWSSCQATRKGGTTDTLDPPLLPTPPP